MSIVLLTVSLLVWTALVVQMDATAAAEIRAQLRGSSFPTAQATVTRSEVEARGTGNAMRYQPVIEFEYRVGRFRYTQRFQSAEASSRPAAAEFVARYPLGSPQAIHAG